MPQAFLLTRHWQDTPKGLVLDYWWAGEQGPIWTRITGQEVVFFVARSDMPEINALLQQQRGWRSRELTLRNYLGEAVNGLYFSRLREARAAERLLLAQGIRCWEADIRPPERFLMERFITAAADIHLSEGGSNQPVLNPVLSPTRYRPTLRLASIDIETSMDAKKLFSIAVFSDAAACVFMVDEESTNDTSLNSSPSRRRGSKNLNAQKNLGSHLRENDGNYEFSSLESSSDSDAEIVYCRNQRECLLQFFAWLENDDPDVLIGWNLVQFDLWVMENLCKSEGIELALGRGKERVHWRQEFDDSGRRFITMPGRVALDGIELLKAANFRFDSFALQSVAETLLGEGKLLHGPDRGEDISILFHSDKPALAAYNLRDCELVWGIFIQQKLVQFAMERSQLTGLLLDRIGGSVAAFEYLYLPRLHRSGFVAPNLGELESDVVSPGGYVMDSRPGIYDNILVLDFKSLYPSIMRTFLIDPCAFWLAEHDKLPEDETLAGYNGAFFAREGHILPQVIADLWAARDRAKIDKNAPLSHAIKIIMNSFYGVLGSPGCRFFDPRVCSSITLRGHDIIQQSRKWIEQQGYAVIYGDTDSLFVWVENHNRSGKFKSIDQCQKIGERLATELNKWWQETLQQQLGIPSALEIQFETHYLRFLMPTLRGSELGTKKRYAGVVERKGRRELVFKGLENVRTDWTRLAKDFQQELYNKIFSGESYQSFVRETVNKLLSGECDQDLIYRKRLRRKLDEYQKNIPPHVQAARKQSVHQGKSMRRGDWIDYVITSQGAEPAQYRQSPLDYQHYLERQLAPVADAILHFLNDSFAAITDRQLGLF